MPTLYQNISIKYCLIIILCLAFIVPNLAFAQQKDEIPPLTKTFIATDKSFSFSYPENWEVTSDGAIIETPDAFFSGVMFSVPLASTGEPNEMGVSLESESMTVSISIHEEASGTTAEDVVLAQAEPLADGEVFTMTEVESSIGNGRPNAFVAVVGTLLPLDNGFYAIDLSDDDDLFMSFWMAGTSDQIERVMVVLPMIFATLQMPAGTGEIVENIELSQTYFSEDQMITFDLPENWTTDEQDTYILITAINGVTLGISAAPPYPGESTDLEELVIARGEAWIVQLSEAVGSEVEAEVQVITIDEQPASRVDYFDGNFQYTSLSIPVAGDYIATVTIIGPTDSVANLENIINALLESLRLPDEEEKGTS